MSFFFSHVFFGIITGIQPKPGDTELPVTDVKKQIPSKLVYASNGVLKNEDISEWRRFEYKIKQQ